MSSVIEQTCLFFRTRGRAYIYIEGYSATKGSGVKSKFSALESLSIQKVGVHRFADPPCGSDKTVTFKSFMMFFKRWENSCCS